MLLSLTIYSLNERKYLSLFDFAVLWKQGGKLAICFSTIFSVDEAAPKVTSGKLWKTLNYISKDLAFKFWKNRACHPNFSRHMDVEGYI